MSTPRRVRHSAVGTNYETPTQTRNERRSSTPAENRRALASGGGGARERGTPVGRLLAAEGLPTRSPRKIRKATLVERVTDWPANVLLGIETSIVDYVSSLDGLGYPIAIALHFIHLLTRLSAFTASLPSYSTFSTRAATHARALADADARLEALKRVARSGRSTSWGWTWGTTISLILVAISVVNALYLFTRRRSYQLVLQTNPLSSPSAHTTTLDFSTSPRKQSGKEALKQWAWSLIGYGGSRDEGRPREFKIQQLDVWTPDYVLYSLRLFSLYSPPIALMYHFLTPSNFFALVISGSITIFQTYLLVSYYTTLLSDRQTLSTEVMREYNVKFVNPRLSKVMKDVACETNQAEHIQREEYFAERDVVVQKGSGRKVVRTRRELWH